MAHGGSPLVRALQRWRRSDWKWINIGILGYLHSLGDSSVLTASDQDHLSREIWDILLRIESRARHLCESRCVVGQCPVVEASCRTSKVVDEKYNHRSRITLYTERTCA